MPPLSASLMEQHGIRPPRAPKSTSLRRSVSSTVPPGDCSSTQNVEEPNSDNRFPAARSLRRHRSMSLTEPPPADTGHLQVDVDEVFKPSREEIGTDEEEEGQDVKTDGIEQEGERWSADEIALRRFFAIFCAGAGMPVLKHNRGRGRVRRVLKFNAEVREIVTVPCF